MHNRRSEKKRDKWINCMPKSISLNGKQSYISYLMLHIHWAWRLKRISTMWELHFSGMVTTAGCFIYIYYIILFIVSITNMAGVLWQSSRIRIVFFVLNEIYFMRLMTYIMLWHHTRHSTVNKATFYIFCIKSEKCISKFTYDNIKLIILPSLTTPDLDQTF